MHPRHRATVSRHPTGFNGFFIESPEFRADECLQGSRFELIRSQYRNSKHSIRAAAIGLVLAGAVLASDAFASLAIDYEPLEVGTQSLYRVDANPKLWEFYKVVQPSPPVMIGGVLVSVIETTDGPHDGTLTYVTNDGNGYRIHGIFMPNPDGEDLTMIYSSPILLLGTVFQVGSTFVSSVDITDLGRAKIDLHIEHESKVLGFETIHVGIGDREAVKIQRTITVSHVCDTGGGQICAADQERVIRSWYSRGLGLIKSEICDNRMDCNNRLDNKNPDHTQQVIYSDKRYLPEPGRALQQLVGVAGMMWHARRRRRANARR
jgi:hypothetical protein